MFYYVSVLFYYVSVRSEFRIVMPVAISVLFYYVSVAIARCDVVLF